VSTPSAGSPRPGVRRKIKQTGFGHTVLWTVGVALVPALLLALAGLYVVRTHRSALLKIALEPQSLRWIAIGCVAAIVLWVALILTTYHLARPSPADAAAEPVRFPARGDPLDGRRRLAGNRGPLRDGDP
jgi:hypothetical protein